MNIGVVGVGRMGANMARRLKDRNFHVTAVYDTNRKVATDLAGVLGCAACEDLAEVTAQSDVIFTVVTDDKAMRNVFSGSGDMLLVNARGKLFIKCAAVSPQAHVDVEKVAEQAGADALGLNLTTLREVFAQTGAASRVLETDGEDIQNRDHSCFFSAAHAAKDSGIALELARELGLDLPLARATKEQYERMIAEGLGELDKSGIAELTFKDRHKHSGDRV